MIIGQKELEAALKKMSILDLHKAASESIKLVQARAKRNCPVNHGELRDSIYTELEWIADTVTAICYTNKECAPHVEFGTGPKGQANHAGVSPDSAGAYVQSPWWIHESQIDPKDAERYHWFYIDTPDGRFYQCTGQAAHPYLYPALKDQENEIEKIFERSAKSQL